MTDITFNCTKCGACCRQVGFIMQVMLSEHRESMPEHLRVTYDEFPYRPLKDGSCFMLDPETNLCRIYDDRPDMCNLDKLYGRFPAGAANLKEWYRQCADSCNTLIEEEELDKRFILHRSYKYININDGTEH